MALRSSVPMRRRRYAASARIVSLSLTIAVIIGGLPGP
jgi:hypothetical protein